MLTSQVGEGFSLYRFEAGKMEGKLDQLVHSCRYFDGVVMFSIRGTSQAADTLLLRGPYGGPYVAKRASCSFPNAQILATRTSGVLTAAYGSAWETETDLRAASRVVVGRRPIELYTEYNTPNASQSIPVSG